MKPTQADNSPSNGRKPIDDLLECLRKKCRVVYEYVDGQSVMVNRSPPAPSDESIALPFPLDDPSVVLSSSTDNESVAPTPTLLSMDPPSRRRTTRPKRVKKKKRCSSDSSTSDSDSEVTKPSCPAPCRASSRKVPEARYLRLKDRRSVLMNRKAQMNCASATKKTDTFHKERESDSDDSSSSSAF